MPKDVDDQAGRDEEHGDREGAPAADTKRQTVLRRRGRRPADGAERRARVQAALDDLTSARVPFSMGDLAERAGISRATLYRDADLRALIGGAGDGPVNRPVDSRRYDKLTRELAGAHEERKLLRRELRKAESRLRAAEKRIAELADEAVDHEKARRTAEATARNSNSETIRAEAYAEGFNAGVRAAAGQRGATAGGSAGGRHGAGGAAANAGLISAAARLPRPALQVARRKLARVLHPDLFAKDDPGTALLATELLKQINALAGGDRG